MNAVLASILFGPNYNFFGYAKIQWSLTSTGAHPVPRTNGTISIVVGSYTILPQLVPLATDGVLAGFEMNELTTSPSFPGVQINDAARTEQTVYNINIQSFEGKLNLPTEHGLTFKEQSASRTIFEGLPNDVAAALASFTFTSSAYGAYQGNAGFIIVVTNTFHKTTGFIQGSITNKAVVMQPIAGALNAPTITEITSSTAKVDWNELPAGFVESSGTPKPSGYLLQVSESSSGPWSDAYKGPDHTHVLSGLHFARTYFMQVFAVNAGGNSPASPISHFTTAPITPGDVTNLAIQSKTATSISLTWTPPTETGGGGISVYTCVAQPTELLGTVMSIITVVAYGPSCTVAGLKGGLAYTLKVNSNNAAGASNWVSIEGSTTGAAPFITHFTASGPATNANVYSDAVTFTIEFDQNTNTPNVADTAAINALLKFTPSIGSAYTGTWTTAHTLTIDIVTTGGAAPVIGTAIVQVIGDIRAQSGDSAASTSTSPTLGGSFGSQGSLGAQVLGTKSGFTGQVDEGVVSPLGVSINLAPLYADGSYQLIVSVISPKLPGSSLSGTGFSPAGLVVTVSGSPTVIQAALDTLVYTPAPGFTGSVSFSFQLLNKASSELLSSLITALNVKAKAAVPTVTAPESVDVILEQYTAVQGVQVGTTDQNNVNNAQFTVAVTVSHTGSAMYSSAVDGVQYSPIQGTESLSLQLTGPIAKLNDALAKLQVKFGFTVNQGQRNYAPDPYTITIEVTDTTEGAAAGKTIRTINANINCETASIAAATVTVAQLDNSGNSILVTLDKPVSDAYLATPVFECANLFDAASVALFGDSPVCHFLSTLSFQIDFGMSAKFVPGFDKINIKDGALQRCVGGSSASPAQTFDVQAPAIPIVPTVFISGPKVTSLCNPLMLQAVSPMVGGRAPVYQWLLPRNLDPAYLPADLTIPVLEVNPLAFGNGGNFTFALSVKNFLGAESTMVSKLVTATNLPVPLIFPTSLTEITQTCTSSVRLYNSITVNPCFSEPLKPMIFAWTITPSIPTSTNNIVMNRANLVIPPNVLTPNINYKATLRVSIATNPDALFTEIDYNINVEPSELAAYIAGGEWRKVRIDAVDWTLDASRSSDPDATSAGLMHAARAAAGIKTDDTALLSPFAADKYTYKWTCATQTGAPCYSTTTGAPIVLAASPVITMPANSLGVGLYSFSVLYTHVPTGRTSTTSALILVREGVPATVYGAAGTVDVLLDSVELFINPNSKLHLMASLPAYFTDSATDLVWDWSILGGGASGISTASLENNANVQGYGTQNLILNAEEVDAFFVPGTDYHFKVTVHHRDDPEAANDAGQAMVYVRVNSLPTCDSFVALPGTGVAFNASFVVNAQNCYDSDSSDLLSYQFFRVDAEGNRFNLLPVSHSPMGRVVLVPTGAAGSNYALTLGVSVLDHNGGRTEYTKDLKITPNELLQAPEGKPYISGIHALHDLYTTSWQANLNIAGDDLMLHVIQAAIVTELNEIATSRGDALTTDEIVELLDFKKQLLSDISAQALILPSVMVLQTLGEIVEDMKHMDMNLIASALDFISARAPLEGGASTDQELLNDYLRVVKTALDFVVTTTSSVSVTGANRRLFATHNSLELGVASGSTTAANPQSVVASALNTLSLLARDISTHALQLNGENFPIKLENTHGFTGAVGRGAAGSFGNISTPEGYGAIVSPTAFAATLAAGAFYDVAVYGMNPLPYIGLISAADASSIVSGAAAVSAFFPGHLLDSAAVTTFAAGDVEVLVPFSMNEADCVQGTYTSPTSNGAASGNVFGNMCKMGCKVWDGNSFSDAGATMVALHPISKQVVCGVNAPGVVVATYTRLSEPYVAPADGAVTGDDSLQNALQPNGLPRGVVRASLMMDPAPVVYDLNAFKMQFVSDMAAVLSMPASRLTVRAVSTTGTQTTVIWDKLAAPSATDISSQTYYNNLISLDASAFKDTTYLKYTVLPTISEMCDDGQYQHVCNSGSSQSTWSKMELPLIIAVCCLVFVCIVICLVYACIRCRRRANAPDTLKMAPPMMGTDLVPAKKFVYTAPNSESGNAEKMSEVTILAKGMEFEPSQAHSQSGSGSGDEVSKNRLAAKFPNKSPAGAAAAGAAGAGAVAGDKDKEESKSSHHFFYVDESKIGGPSGAGGSRRGSRNDSGVAFSMNDGARNELSHSSSSRSGNSQSAAPDAVEERRRRGSGDDGADKAALPVVRPGQK